MLLLAALPTTWLRTPVADPQSAEVRMIVIAPVTRESGAFSVQGLWQLQALNEGFGGYSALALNGPTVRLFSDKGWLLTLPRADRPGVAVAPSMRRLNPAGLPPAEMTDIESVTGNDQTGQFWLGYENRDTIYRYGHNGAPERFVAPSYARHWGDNSGIEAMARLADGRFVVLREVGGLGWLYPSDPVEGATPVAFRINWPEDYSPVDMAALPDGRVLILLRRLAWRYPVFETRLVLANPGEIDPERPWPLMPLLQLETLLPRDNYEALAVEPAADGSVTFWLASDDNRSAFQRSLLAKLRWDPESSPP